MSDQAAGSAVAGFLLALASFVASVLAAILASGTGLVSGVPLLRRLGPALEQLHDAIAPSATSGEGMLLFTAAVVVACVGFVLSVRGPRSRSRGLALSGVLLSSIVAVCFGLVLVILYMGWSHAFQYGVLPGNSLYPW